MTESTEELHHTEFELEERVRARTEALTKLNKALSREMQELVAEAAELERSNRDLEHFAFIAAHDLQAPLRHVDAYCRLLIQRVQKQLDPEANEYLSYIVVTTDRMAEMLDSLLAYSRLGTQERELEPVDSGDVLRSALTHLREDIAESEAIVTYESLPEVMADRNQLLRLFQNLIGNAIKYRSDETPVIQVACERKDDEWEFSVRDNGIGINPKQSESVFEIFARLHSNQKSPGSGIGLATCKRIVERHGGRIWVAGNGQQGTAIHFRWPARELTKMPL